MGGHSWHGHSLHDRMTKAYIGGALGQRLHELGLAVARAEEALKGAGIRAIQQAGVVHDERRHGEGRGERATAHQEGGADARQEPEVQVTVGKQWKTQISSLKMKTSKIRQMDNMNKNR